MNANITALMEVKEQLETSQHVIRELIPQVGMQVVCGYHDINNELTINSIAAFDGRIRKLKSGIHIGEVELGCSTTLASLLIDIQRIFPSIHSLACIKYESAFINQLQAKNYNIVEIDRTKDANLKCSQTLPKQITSLHAQEELVDIIYDLGAHGLEPIIRVLGQSPQEVLNIILDLK